MNVRSLVPWTRQRGVPATRFSEPAGPLSGFHREMHRAFDEFLRDFDAFGGWGGAERWPHIELSETDKELEVVAELPGLEERDIEVTFADGILRLKGEKKAERNGSLYSERWSGAFVRDIEIGSDVDPEKIKASFRNGVLTVTLSRKPQSERKVRRIGIN